MIPGLLFSLAAALLVLNAYATWRVVNDPLATVGQRLGQFALVWVVPCIGALLILHLQRRDLEHSSGRYPREPEPPDDWPSEKAARQRIRDIIDDE